MPPPPGSLSYRAVGGLVLTCAAGCLVFATSLWLVVHHHTAGFDGRAFDVLGASRGGVLAHAARTLETVGVIVLALAGGSALLVLLRQRAWLDALALSGGFVLCVVLAHAVKFAEQRPRPVGGLVRAGGYSFPSTDSALAVGAVAAALVLARTTSGHRERRALIATGLLLALAAGLLFVALRVHYLSDVVAGWALGAACFSGCALLACVLRALQRKLSAT